MAHGLAASGTLPQMLHRGRVCLCVYHDWCSSVGCCLCRLAELTSTAPLQANRVKGQGRQLQGANSIVFKIRVQGAVFALKGILPLGQVSRNPAAASRQKLERNASEYRAQIILCHPSIARVRHAFTGPSDLVLPWIPEDFFIEGVVPWRSTTYIVTDFLATFESWLEKKEAAHSKAPFGITERSMQLIMLQLATAVEHMVSNSIAHNDLKVGVLCMRGSGTPSTCSDACCAQLDNLFLQPNGRIVIGDFGEASLLITPDGAAIPTRTHHVIVRFSCRALLVLGKGGPRTDIICPRSHTTLDRPAEET